MKKSKPIQASYTVNYETLSLSSWVSLLIIQCLVIHSIALFCTPGYPSNTTDAGIRF